MSALLALSNARIDEGGAVLVDGVSFESKGESVALVGAWEPLFALAAGRARLASGSAKIRGEHPRRGVRDGRIGLALAGSVLPEAWTALAYLEQSAELLGLAPRAARSAARAALATTALAHLETRRVQTLTVAERRALMIAHTTIGSPAVLLIETPLAGLDSHSETLVGEVLERAALGRSLLVSVSAPAPLGGERALVDRLGEVVVLEAGVLVAQGDAQTALRGENRYAVTVTRLGSELVKRLTDLGLQATISGEQAEGARLVVDLSAHASTDDLIDAALAIGAPIVELVPLDEIAR